MKIKVTNGVKWRKYTRKRIKLEKKRENCIGFLQKAREIFRHFSFYMIKYMYDQKRNFL